jgi:septum site-determining protein MinC
MPPESKSHTVPIFEIKSATLGLVSFHLKTSDLNVLAAELARRFADTPDFFSDDPVLVDLSALAHTSEVPDFSALRRLLKPYRIHPVAVAQGNVQQHEAAFQAGLPLVQPDGLAGEHSHHHPGEREVVREVVREVRVEVPVNVVREVPAELNPTHIVDKPLRSGQQVYAKGSDLVVLAMVNFGAEVIADGCVHVYAPLRGKVIAGAKADEKARQARIFTACLEAELISIAGVYRTGEKELPPEVRGKPAQIRLEGDKLIIEPLNL